MADQDSLIDYQWDLKVEELQEDFELDIQYNDPQEAEDVFWQARTGLTPETLCAAVEAIIFMSDKPISLQKIKTQIDSELPLRVVHQAISELQEKFEDQKHGIRLMEVAQGFQFRTKVTYSRFIQKMFKASSLVLSPSALEVLSIIAYRQPVSKHFVEKVRGVDSSHIIRSLVDKRLVKIVGRSDELGKPSLYGTTQEFLEVFNLASLESLPTLGELEEMAQVNSVGEITDIKEVVSQDGHTHFKEDELDELDRLSASIKSIAAYTDFTKSLSDEEKRKVEQKDAETPTRSAFDILEEYLVKSEAAKQNTEAQDSCVLSPEELLNEKTDTTDKTKEPPRSKQEENFTPLFSEEELEDQEWIEDGSYDDAPSGLELGATEEIVDMDEGEEKELEDALDKAFSNLSSWEDETSNSEQAKDLDLDLNFLQEDLDSQQT